MTIIATWKELGIEPPQRANRTDLNPIEAAQADYIRLKAEIAALEEGGRLPKECKPHWLGARLA